MKLRLLLLLLLISLCFNTFATHIVGGELELVHHEGYNYTVRLNLYFDDIHGDPARKDEIVKIGIFEKGTNRRIRALSLLYRGSTTIEPSNEDCTTSDLKTSRILYTKNISLDPAIYNNPNGYYIASEICCRNSPISNIASPGEAGTTFYLEFPAVVKNGVFFRNSSPRLASPNNNYACVGELFYANFGGKDRDGDELVYDLVTPLSGHSAPGRDAVPPASPAPYPEVKWLPGYSKANQVQGSPALSIDRNTGRLTVKPEYSGLFVFGVRCQEFRNGVKIGEVRRDYQLLVKACAPNEPPQVSAMLPGSKQPYQEGQVLRIGSNDPRCLKVQFTDPDEAEEISLEAKPVNFNNKFFRLYGVRKGVVNAGGKKKRVLEATLCLNDCFDTNGGIYLLDLIVKDQGSDVCSTPSQDTLRLSLMVEPVPIHPPELSLSTTKRVMEVSEGDIISFDVTGKDRDSTRVGVSAVGRHFDMSTQNITFEAKKEFGQVVSTFTWKIDCEALKKPSYQIEFTATSANCGELQTKSEIIEIITKRKDIANNLISEDQVVCFGETPQALTGSLPAGSAGPFIYAWEISMSGDNDSYMPAPGVNNEQHYTPPTLSSTAWYRRKVMTGACQESTSEPVKIAADVLQPSAGQDMTIIQGAVAGLNAIGGETYSWSPATGLSDPNIHNPIAKPQETTTYTVTVTTAYGCVYTDEVTLTVLPRVEPTNAITLNHDNINDTWFIKNIEYYPDCRVQVFTRWGTQVFESKGYREPWNGTHNGNELPMSAYFYIIDLGVNEATLSGSITLLK